MMCFCSLVHFINANFSTEMQPTVAPVAIRRRAAPNAERDNDSLYLQMIHNAANIRHILMTECVCVSLLQISVWNGDTYLMGRQ